MCRESLARVRCRRMIGQSSAPSSNRSVVCIFIKTVTPRSGYDLEAAFIQRPEKQGRKHSLNADALGKLSEGRIVIDATGVGGGLGEDGKWQVAVFRGGVRIHGTS